MYSIDFVESAVKSLIPAHLHERYDIEMFAWNRTKADKSDPEFFRGPALKSHRPRSPYDWDQDTQSATNQKVGEFECDIKNWHQQCLKARIDAKKDELGIGMLIQKGDRSSTYLAMIDFNPGLMDCNRRTLSFWKDISDRYKGRKLYLFNSGNSHHGLLYTIHDNRAHAEWTDFLQEHEEVVDQKWVEFACAHEHGGVIRTTTGKNRPQPTLLKWVNL